MTERDDFEPRSPCREPLSIPLDSDLAALDLSSSENSSEQEPNMLLTPQKVKSIPSNLVESFKKVKTDEFSPSPWDYSGLYTLEAETPNYSSIETIAYDQQSSNPEENAI